MYHQRNGDYLAMCTCRRRQGCFGSVASLRALRAPLSRVHPTTVSARSVTCISRRERDTQTTCLRCRHELFGPSTVVRSDVGTRFLSALLRRRVTTHTCRRDQSVARLTTYSRTCAADSINSYHTIPCGRTTCVWSLVLLAQRQ